MSGLIEKAKEIIQPGKKRDDTEVTGDHATTTAPTGTHVTESTAHHADAPSNAFTATHAPSSGVSDTPALSSGGIHNRVTGAGSGVGPETGGKVSGVGPHDSSFTSKADPRIDSDLDASRNAGLARGTGTHNTVTGAGSKETNVGGAGPHGASLANRADPRVDSNFDGSRDAGLAHGTGTHNIVTGTGSAREGTVGGAGPHSSTLTNKADPRVDSDFDGSRNAGLAGSTTAGRGTTTGGTLDSHTGTGGTYTTGTSGHGGLHTSTTANVADPRVDSDRDASKTLGHSSTANPSTGIGASDTIGGGARAGTAAGFPGPAPNTAGPHKSDMLNKMDPRVDSDRDASKTIGGDKTIT